MYTKQVLEETIHQWETIIATPEEAVNHPNLTCPLCINCLLSCKDCPIKIRLGGCKNTPYYNTTKNIGINGSIGANNVMLELLKSLRD